MATEHPPLEEIREIDNDSIVGDGPTLIEAYVDALSKLPLCPQCGTKAVFHADSTDEQQVLTCTVCGRTGLR